MSQEVAEGEWQGGREGPRMDNERKNKKLERRLVAEGRDVEMGHSYGKLLVGVYLVNWKVTAERLQR